MCIVNPKWNVMTQGSVCKHNIYLDSLQWHLLRMEMCIALFPLGSIWNELLIIKLTQSLDYKFITLAHFSFGWHKSTSSLTIVNKRNFD